MENLKNKKKRIVIIGARIDGHAGVILNTLEVINEYELVGFIDNSPDLQNKLVNGVAVIGSTDDLESLEIQAEYAHIAIGDNVMRGKLFMLLKHRGLIVSTLVHPTATISKKAKIGEGCFIGPHAVVNNGVVIGAVCIINTGAIIEHDNKIGYAVHMAPGTKTAGRVQVDDYAFVGIGANILPDIHIGTGAMVGAGSTVVKDVSPRTTVFGYAAKKYSKNIYFDTQSDVDVAE